MEMLVRWIWLGLALAFFLAEIFTAGFVLACFGVGAAAAGVVAFVGGSPAWQLLTFVVVSTVSVLFSRRFADRVSTSDAEKVGVDRVLGKQAVVVEAIEPDSTSGRVRVEREEWRAESTERVSIPEGTRVEVMSVEGTRLQVRPV